MKRSEKDRFNCAADDLTPAMSSSTTTTTNATAEPQQQKQHAHQNMRFPSSSSLAESNACALTHQYHYIQYPAYYQLMHDRQLHAAATMSQTVTTCRCPCSCGNTMTGSGMSPLNNPPGRHKHQHSSDDSQMAVAVIVHQQEGGDVKTTSNDGAGGNQQVVTKTKSEQSLLNHSYQAWHGGCEDEKQLNLAETASCDCDLECTCAVSLPQKSKHFGSVGMSALMLGADEITVSESDNNSTMVKRKGRDKKSHKWSSHKDNILDSDINGCKRKSAFNSSQIDIYSDGEGDGTDSCLKVNNDGTSDDDQRPPLPPRPPPRPRNVIVNMNAHRNGAGGIKKYVVWCLICGGFSCLLGILFLGVYFLLHSYTITVGNFETVPTFVPATLLILTGLCIMSLARRRNRYSYLIKLSGACGLISALTCALVTVTTTVLHMSRLQALRECEYAQKTRTCTCYSDILESQVERVDKEGVRLVFDSLSDCGVVHGSLYSCLRAIFGLSVAGVLIAVFSCMLVYQLLSHERKKMYWEQLELRCRSLYTSQQGPQPPSMAMVGGRANVCRCCEQCHAHRQVPLQPSAYPWDDGAEPRFWTGQPPGNFYSPNPGGDDLQNNVAITCRGHGITANSRSRVTGWSWPRMPWQRSSPVANSRFRQTPSSPDSQYGFSNTTQPPAQPPTAAEVGLSEEQVFNGVPGASLPYGVWGPPPPYSDPNSPARRGYYQFAHHPNGACANAPLERQPMSNVSEQHNSRMDCRSNHRTAFGSESQQSEALIFCAQTTSMRNLGGKRQTQGSGFKPTTSKGDYENTPSDSDTGARDHFSNTLPTRKLKKRVEIGAKSIGPNSQSTQRVNVQHVFSDAHCASDSTSTHNTHAYNEPIDPTNVLNGENFANGNSIDARNCIAQTHVATQRHKIGVENSAFQNSTECGANAIDGHAQAGHCDPTESEVYFADVSSCCNISVKNDNYYDEANQAQTEHCPNHHGSHSQHNHNHHHHHHQQHQLQHHQQQHQQQHQQSDSNSNNVEDYLAQRFGKRENSIRSRLPFPQTCNDGDYNADNLNVSNQVVSNNSTNGMQKDISRHSMCSVDSEAKTEFTDLSPSTPCGSNFIVPHCESTLNDTTEVSMTSTTATTTTTTTLTTPSRMPTAKSFVASLPYSSESQSLEAHRRSIRNLGTDQQMLVTAEAQYEIINDAAAAACKPITYPVTGQSNVRSAKIAGSQAPTRPTILRTSTNQASIKKASKREFASEKNPNCYQSDLEWSDSGSSNCAKEREHL